MGEKISNLKVLNERNVNIYIYYGSLYLKWLVRVLFQSEVALEVFQKFTIFLKRWNYKSW